MKNLFTNLVLFILVFALIQCQSGQKGSHAKIVEVNGNEVIDCNVSEITDTIDLPLSSIIKECEFIPLGTNDSSLFESVNHVGLSENYIAIHSHGQHPIKLFGRKGNFIRDIGSIGRGPGEFSSLYGIQLDEAANRLYLTPFANATQLIVYNLEGEDLEPIPLVYKQTKCKVYVEGNTVTVLSMPFNNEIPVAYRQTTGGELIQKLPVIDHLILRPDFSSEISSSFNAGAYDLFILPYGSETYDTLYYYDVKSNMLVPKYVNSFPDKKSGNWVFELKDHYWSFIFGDKYNGAKIIVDKNTLKSDFFNIQNDFYGNIPVNKFYMSTNGWFISSISAIELLREVEEALKNGDLGDEQKQKLTKIKTTVKENDNDVLFVGKM